MNQTIYLDPDTPISLLKRRVFEASISRADYDDEMVEKIEKCLESIPSFQHKNDSEYIFALMPWDEPELFQDVYESSIEIPEPVKNALRAAQQLNSTEKPEDPGYLMIVLD